MNDSICIVVYNTVTKECQVKYFENEELAFDFVRSFN
jgi:hypothetical protein